MVSLPSPLPTATEREIQAVQDLYRAEFGVALTAQAAKTLVEGVMHVLVLTYYEDALRSLRAQKQ